MFFLDGRDAPPIVLKTWREGSGGFRAGVTAFVATTTADCHIQAAAGHVKTIIVLLRRSILYYTVLYCAMLYCAILYCTVLYYNGLYYTAATAWPVAGQALLGVADDDDDALIFSRNDVKRMKDEWEKEIKYKL